MNIGTCGQCGEAFPADRYNQSRRRLFCSDKCRVYAWREMAERALAAQLLVDAVAALTLAEAEPWGNDLAREAGTAIS